MTGIKIRKRDMEFLTSEVSDWKEQEIITSEQADEILSLYEVKKSNLRAVLLSAGGVLLGLGAVSFFAAHWHELPKLFRVCLISGAYILSLIAYYFTRTSRTGKAFLLLGSIIFGAGIYLITRMYNYKLYWYSVIGWWIIQALVTSFSFRDIWQLYLAQILSFIYLNAIEAIDIFALEFINLPRVPVIEFISPLSGFAVIISLWFVWYMTHDRTAFNVNMLMTMMLLASRMSLCFGGTMTLILLAVSGAVMSFISGNRDAEIFGLLMLGLFGMLLTWPEYWRGYMFSASTVLPVVSAVVVGIIMILNIYRGHTITGITFFGLLVIRYFFDHLFGYIPKAWGFTAAGIIFLLAGIFFGKLKRIFKRQEQNQGEG